MSSSIERAIARMNVPRNALGQNDTVTPLRESRRSRTIEAINSAAARREAVQADTVADNLPPPLQFDFNALARDGYLTPETMQSDLAEQYRLLKHSLLAPLHETKAQPTLQRKLIAITSTVKGEGKTFTSFNLAMSLAMERNLEVLLIDNDLIARSLSRMMGLDARTGLADAILDPNLTMESICIPTNVPHLALLPAGKPHQHVTELVSSDQMRELTRLLSFKDNQIVLFDAPPVLSTSVAVALTRLVDQVLIVVEEGGTLQNALLKTLSLVANENISIVLNKCKVQKSISYY